MEYVMCVQGLTILHAFPNRFSANSEVKFTKDHPC